MAKKMVDGVLLDMTPEEEAELLLPPPVIIPQVVAMSSFQLILDEIGEYDNAVALIDSLPMPDKRKAEILWKSANSVERSHPFVISLGAAMGKTEAEIDDIFIQAATL